VDEDNDASMKTITRLVIMIMIKVMTMDDMGEYPIGDVAKRKPRRMESSRDAIRIEILLIVDVSRRRDRVTPHHQH